MSVRRLVVVVLAALFVLVLGAGPAEAGTGFGFGFSFGSPEGFVSPTGLGVDRSSGDVYVSDDHTETLKRFSIEGQEAKELWSIPVAGLPYQLTVDNNPGGTQGDAYVASFNGGTVSVFNANHEQVGATITGLVSPTDVAVDSQGFIYVAQYFSGTVLRFNSKGEKVNAEGHLSSENVMVSQPGQIQGLAVDANGDIFLATEAGASEYVLTGGVYVQSVVFTSSFSTGIAVAPSGSVFVDLGGRIAEYKPSGEALTEFGSGILSGTTGGVDVDGALVYVADPGNDVVQVFEEGPTPEPPVTEAATYTEGTSAVLHGRLDPHASLKTGWYFAYNTNGTCTGGATTPLQPQVEGVGIKESTEVTGLEIGVTYTFCFVAENNNGSVYGEPISFTTTGPPSVVGEAFSGVGTKGATLSAQIAPNGSTTTYYFEYGTTNAYGSRTPETNLNTTEGIVTVSSKLEGLPPDTKYHFRAVATNKDGTEQGTDTAFSTLASVLNGLPDGRAYEMVTPIENEDAEIYVPTDGTGAVLGQGQGVTVRGEFQSSPDGNSVSYYGDPTKGGTGNGGDGGGNSYLATRSPGGGWTQANTSKPSSSQQPPPLFTVTPPNRSPWLFHSTVVGSSVDGSRVFFEADDDLIPGEGRLEKELAADVKSEVEHNEYNNNLYESVQGQVSPVDVLPEGKIAGSAIFGATPYGEPTINPTDVSNVVSSSGSRVFWTDLNTDSLYVRENPGKPESSLSPQGECTVATDACTVQIDASQAHGPGGGGRFWTASKDGSKVYFTDSDAAGLTSSTVAGSGTNLYEYEINPTVGQSGVLKDLTPEAEAGVEGVIGASEDGEYVYFVATSILSDNENNSGQTAVKDGYNLYLIHAGASPRFIATLSQDDGYEVNPFRRIERGLLLFGDWQPGLGHRTAEVSSNGEGLVFMSEENLTGYPSLVDGEKLDEVFVYEAGSNHLFCVSCSQSGEPPRGNLESEGLQIGGFVQIAWGNGGLRWMSENGGRVFFDSGQPLVAQDTNEAQDVYEWERDGVGSCGQSEGCVYLLSGGTSPSASWLEGESGSGDDVFIDTRAQLTPEDHSETYNLFDARVDGVQPVSEPSCSGTGCQGAPSPPPTFATPPSVTFEGVGNFLSSPIVYSTPRTTKKKTVKCSRAKKLSHDKCVKAKAKNRRLKAKKVKSNKGSK